MATYYQRQRLPPPTQSFLDELEAPDSDITPVHKTTSPQTQSSERKLEQTSFLIFPEPTAPALTIIPSPIILNANASNAVIAGSSKPPASPLSRSDSSSSLPASLVASVARQSEGRAPTSVRSRSRDALGSDWEEIRGPLPKASLRLRARGRPKLSERPSFTSTTASRTPLTPLSENERGRLERDLGWDWTLDNEDASPGRDMLLSWQRMTAETASSIGEDDHIDSEGYSNYEDAASQLHDLVSYTNGSLVDEEESVTSEVVRVRSPARRRRSIGSPEFRGGVRIERDAENRPRRYSFRLSSPSSRREPRILRPIAPPQPRVASRTLPFGTLLQAIFSVDRDTIDLIDDPTSTAGPNLFGIRDAPLPSQLPTKEELASEREASQALRLLRSPETIEPRTLRMDGLATDKALLHAFRAAQLLPTNPFALPFYLLGIGWEYGLKNMMALHRIILEEDSEA